MDYKCEIVKAIKKLVPMSRATCLRCKFSRLLCGMPRCPLLEKIKLRAPIEKKLKEEMYGPSPSIFVGHSNYPRVFAGPLTSVEPEIAQISDNPAEWYGYDFNKIVAIRSSLVRAKKRVDVYKPSVVEAVTEIALSEKPIYSEVKFEKKPVFTISFSPLTQPLGPSGIVEKVDVAENPKIPLIVESFVDSEVKAEEALVELYRHGYDVYYLTRIMSAGALGKIGKRKLVPTRWSITAVDDIIARKLISEIKEHKTVNHYLVYENTYLDNHFEILLLPRKWEYEQFEAWAPSTIWTLALEKPAINYEYEGFKGRSSYAEQEAGGYYAARLGVVEALKRMRRQAACVVFREIYEGYIMPVGVWEVRENVRRAMQKEPERFETLREALESISSRLRLPMREYLRRSRILTQRRLEQYA